VSGALILGSGCNSLDEPGVEGDSKVVIPTDARGVVQTLKTLPSISGGTLAVSSDGARAVVADPDRDRVSIVFLAAPDSVTNIALQPGDEPGRVAIDGARAFVALRGSGNLITLDMNTGSVLSRTRVCAAPRGVAVDPSASLVHVACAEGRLVSLNLAGDTVVRDVRLDGDLRDVLVMRDGSGLRVSTFKSSQLLALDATGTMLSRTAPEPFNVLIENEVDDPDAPVSSRLGVPSRLSERPMQAHLAWRAVQSVDGTVMMLHQASAAEEVDIKKARKIENGQVSSPYGGSGSSGAALGCQGVVVTSLSRFGSEGFEQTVGLEGGVLTVDAALSPDGTEITIVEAGTADSLAPRPTVVSKKSESAGEFATSIEASSNFFSVNDKNGNPVANESRIMRASVPGLGTGPFGSSSANCNFPREQVGVPGQATAVAYLENGDLVVQSREPALLTIVPSTKVQFSGVAPRLIELGGDSVSDTGHALFHRDSGGGIACASCHAEGAEDGHTWNFKGQGLRRTQALHVGLAGTAPFHWAGDETDLNALMEDVFVGRMGGVHQSQPRVASLSKFLFALKPPAAARAIDDEAAVRGKALFESAAMGCTNCHTGDKLTDNKNYDVGTSHGELLQVPSLRGVAYRAPFIHTGCAATLRDRFDPSCGGGSKHGNTAGLSTLQVDDVIAYLQTL
jgi:hypothetical protein